MNLKINFDICISCGVLFVFLRIIGYYGGIVWYFYCPGRYHWWWTVFAIPLDRLVWSELCTCIIYHLPKFAVAQNSNPGLEASFLVFKNVHWASSMLYIVASLTNSGITIGAWFRFLFRYFVLNWSTSFKQFTFKNLAFPTYLVKMLLMELETRVEHTEICNIHMTSIFVFNTKIFIIRTFSVFFSLGLHVCYTTEY